MRGWPFNAPFYLILNVAFGGNFGGKPDDGCLPQSMEIEYVRVYQ
jgi:beta-glucanase (GH16 family)